MTSGAALSFVIPISVTGGSPSGDDPTDEGMATRQWTRKAALRSLHEVLLETSCVVQNALDDLDLGPLESCTALHWWLWNPGKMMHVEITGFDREKIEQTAAIIERAYRFLNRVRVRGEEPLQTVLVKELLEDSLLGCSDGDPKSKIISGYIIEGFDGKYYVTGINTEIFDDDRPEIALEVALGLRELCYIEQGVLDALSCAVEANSPYGPINAAGENGILPEQWISNSRKHTPTLVRRTDERSQSRTIDPWLLQWLRPAVIDDDDKEDEDRSESEGPGLLFDGLI